LGINYDRCNRKPGFKAVVISIQINIWLFCMVLGITTAKVTVQALLFKANT